MEIRKIYVNDTASNNVLTVETNATTFGELKAAVRAAGVDIEGKDWLEGITKTTPTSDDSLLPVNVTYHGNVTNDLVFVLTNTNKKIKSGAMSYAEMRSFIKVNGLADEFQRMYGRHYTHGTSEQFAEFIEYVTRVNSEESCPCEKHHEALAKALATFIYNLGEEFITELNDCMADLAAQPEVSSLNLTPDEVRAYFK